MWVPPRIGECPVQMEAELVEAHEMMSDVQEKKVAILALELKVLRVHVEDELRLDGFENRVDVERLRPLFMVFQEFFGMKRGMVEGSRLAEMGRRTIGVELDASFWQMAT
jgi:flavin reductase (DIM6/NTAB) family NADH-FMN oxidoreductase RutF